MEKLTPNGSLMGMFARVKLVYTSQDICEPTTLSAQDPVKHNQLQHLTIVL